MFLSCNKQLYLRCASVGVRFDFTFDIGGRGAFVGGGGRFITCLCYSRYGRFCWRFGALLGNFAIRVRDA